MNISPRFDDERGFALVLALAMLAILSILGAFALTTSTTEVGISSNYLTTQQSFFAAERAVEFARSQVDNFDDDVDLGDFVTDLAVGRSGLLNEVGVSTYSRLGSRPSEAHGMASGQVVLYQISVTGQAQDGGAQSRIDTQLMRVIPGAGSGEDGQFFTTGSGG